MLTTTTETSIQVNVTTRGPLLHQARRDRRYTVPLLHISVQFSPKQYASCPLPLTDLTICLCSAFFLLFAVLLPFPALALENCHNSHLHLHLYLLHPTPLDDLFAVYPSVQSLGDEVCFYDGYCLAPFLTNPTIAIAWTLVRTDCHGRPQCW